MSIRLTAPVGRLSIVAAAAAALVVCTAPGASADEPSHPLNYGDCVQAEALDPSSGETGPQTVNDNGQNLPRGGPDLKVGCVGLPVQPNSDASCQGVTNGTLAPITEQIGQLNKDQVQQLGGQAYGDVVREGAQADSCFP